MGFKMKGWSAFSKPEVKSPLTDSVDDPVETTKIKKKNRPTPSEIDAAMEKPIENASYEDGTADYQGDPYYEPTFTDKEIELGAGASSDFYDLESGGYRTKLGIKTGWEPGGTHWSGKTGDVVTQGPGHPTINIEKTTGKQKKAKPKGKKNLITGKIKLPIDTIDQKTKKAEKKEKELEEETGEFTYIPGTAGDDYKWRFEGPMDIDKDISDKERQARLNPKTGLVEEMYKTDLGIWRKTGRDFTDPAYIDAAQENIQEAADWEAKSDQRDADDEAQKEKDKLDKQAQKNAANAAREAGESSYVWNGVTYHFDWRSRK
jgi:hypothetical protein